MTTEGGEWSGEERDAILEEEFRELAEREAEEARPKTKAPPTEAEMARDAQAHKQWTEATTMATEAERAEWRRQRAQLEEQEDRGGEMAEEIEAKTRFYRISAQLARLNRIDSIGAHDPIQTIAMIAASPFVEGYGPEAIAIYEEILAKLLEPVAEPEKKL
jgi:hypothetical protein